MKKRIDKPDIVKQSNRVKVTLSSCETTIRKTLNSSCNDLFGDDDDDDDLLCAIAEEVESKYGIVLQITLQIFPHFFANRLELF